MRRERIPLGRIIIKSLPTLRRKYKFRTKSGEGGACAERGAQEDHK